MNNYYYILGLVFFLGILYYCFTTSDMVTENFETVAGGTDDTNAINTLAQLAKQLMSSTGAIVPGSLTIQGGATIGTTLAGANGTLTVTGNQTVGGNLDVTGNSTIKGMTITPITFMLVTGIVGGSQRFLEVSATNKVTTNSTKTTNLNQRWYFNGLFVVSAFNNQCLSFNKTYEFTTLPLSNENIIYCCIYTYGLPKYDNAAGIVQFSTQAKLLCPTSQAILYAGEDGTVNYASPLDGRTGVIWTLG